MARKYTRKPKEEPKPKMYKVTINEFDNDPVYFTPATSEAEAITKVLPRFFADHAGENITDVQIEDDADATFIP